MGEWRGQISPKPGSGDASWGRPPRNGSDGATWMFDLRLASKTELGGTILVAIFFRGVYADGKYQDNAGAYGLAARVDESVYAAPDHPTESHAHADGVRHGRARVRVPFPHAYVGVRGAP